MQSHTGRTAQVQDAWLDERGRLFLRTDIGFGLVHSLDMEAASDALDGDQLATVYVGGEAFQAVDAPPGYLSSIATTGATVLATGLSGTLASRDGGHFERLTAQPYNVVRLIDRKTGVLGGPGGTVGLWRA